MKVKCDDRKIQLTEAFIEAIKNLMKEEILMFRVREQNDRECWVVGACHIEDLMNANGISFSYGGINDKEYLFKNAHITVEIEL